MYVPKLSIIINAGFTDSAYNQNIDKWLALYKFFLKKFCLPENLTFYKLFALRKFGTVSLGTLVPNSRDRHEKQWQPDFTRHKTHPKIRFV